MDYRLAPRASSTPQLIPSWLYSHLPPKQCGVIFTNFGNAPWQVFLTDSKTSKIQRWVCDICVSAPHLPLECKRRKQHRKKLVYCQSRLQVLLLGQKKIHPCLSPLNFLNLPPSYVKGGEPLVILDCYFSGLNKAWFWKARISNVCYHGKVYYISLLRICLGGGKTGIKWDFQDPR